MEAGFRYVAAVDFFRELPATAGILFRRLPNGRLRGGWTIVRTHEGVLVGCLGLGNSTLGLLSRAVKALGVPTRFPFIGTKVSDIVWAQLNEMRYLPESVVRGDLESV